MSNGDKLALIVSLLFAGQMIGYCWGRAHAASIAARKDIPQ